MAMDTNNPTPSRGTKSDDANLNITRPCQMSRALIQRAPLNHYNNPTLSRNDYYDVYSQDIRRLYRKPRMSVLMHLNPYMIIASIQSIIRDLAASDSMSAVWDADKITPDIRDLMNTVLSLLYIELSSHEKVCG